ncbi:MAG: hypothetical protein U0169_26130 [Polyangiaceae bacterium]
MTRAEHGSKGITAIAGFVQCAAIAGLVATASCTNGRVAELAPREDTKALVTPASDARAPFHAGLVEGGANDAGAPDAARPPTSSDRLRAELSPLVTLLDGKVGDGGRADVWIVSSENDRQLCRHRAPASSLDPVDPVANGATPGASTKIEVEACIGASPVPCDALVTEWKTSYQGKPESKTEKMGDVLDVSFRGERKFAWAPPDRPRFPSADASLRAWTASRDGSCVYFRLEGNRRDVESSARSLRVPVSRAIQGIVGLR